ncbi:peptidylprolyl isomerase [Bacillus paralicheniformis]|jgi:foldase protein PrsA|uniref:Foldase protein PrsA n=2 Tax=Bacillus paralicheniformis TaxID=1648923 RepID=A0A6I7TMQ5_9BACI|nr:MULTISPECIES: peptidylprolyl isomerase [Bacillus]ETB70762.1 foldase PrsA [Bacillus sp. CPSM8]KJD53191.1 peptidylprolyl isomerase [Bacillus amyloliquefaciens]KUL14536.1 foldase PrsA [Bacillus licheniformis LMG 7559]KUL17422.1 foldase PrsA [Bacillus licheniformis LMG 6934]MBC8623985.1 peptidylprolyl isomerase [Robertmurraya crescens]POO83506.1 peptidylprolyl isomerase [Bacillus sp. MBGLi97]
MKKIAIAAITATSVLALSACSGGDSEVVAETKAGNITKEDLYQTLKDNAGADALNMLVQQKVLDDKYNVSDKEIDKKLNEYKKSMGDQLNQLIEQKGEDFVKEQIKYELLMKKAAKDNIKVTDDDVKEYYDGLKGKIHLSHILVKEKKTAEEVEKKLKKGEKFEDLAKEYSTDGTAEKGGDLGWVGKEDNMDKDFVKAAFALKTGEISGPVKSQFGYHIIKKDEERGKYEDMKKDLKKEVQEQKQNDQTELQSVIDKLVKDADLKVKDKELKKQVDQRQAQTSSSS